MFVFFSPKQSVRRILFTCTAFFLLAALTGCVGVKIVRIPVPVPTIGLGGPKVAQGETVKDFHQTGIASWYGKQFQNRPTASGEPFDMHAMTAAHPSLPFGTKVKVRNLRNGKECVVRINDRGPSRDDRIIDVSWAVARRLDFDYLGLTQVEINVM